jgi:hypothetical protein
LGRTVASGEPSEWPGHGSFIEADRLAQRFDKAEPPRTVMLDTNFAGIGRDALMSISSPGVIGTSSARVPPGETRSIERMRHELTRAGGGEATWPVTTAIYLGIVAEATLMDLADGAAIDAVVPFWRLVAPGSTIAGRLICDNDFFDQLRHAEATTQTAKAEPPRD